MEISFRDWYKEVKTSESNSPTESTVEIFFFYLNVLLLFIFSILFLYTDILHRSYLVFFIPTLIWIFLRSSRKDMTATAHWVAGFFGAIGGAASVLLLRIFLK